MQDERERWGVLVADVAHMLGASAVHGFRLSAELDPTLTAATGIAALPAASERMARALMGRAIARGTSLESDSPSLDRDLAALAAPLATTGSAVHVRLLPAHGAEAPGLAVVHWVSEPPPGHERLARFGSYWDCAGLAFAAAADQAA